MNYLSVCSGIEAATVAWDHLGWKPVAFSEIEKFPSAVLAHHYPEVPNLGDMTKYDEWKFDRPIDLLCGGTPCQSFSIAGLRKGMEDPRGNLSLVFVEIAAKFRPAWVVWENVAGVFSSAGGADFGTFLGALTGRDIQTPSDGWRNSGAIQGITGAYSVAWRVYDAQYFGLAQRRRRVFVVGHLGDWRAAAAVLFESESLCGNLAPSREARKGTARSAKKGTGGESIVIDRAAFNQGENAQYDPHVEETEVMDTLVARGPHAVGVPTIMAHGQGGAEIAIDRCPTLTCNHEAPIAVHGTQDPCVQNECAHAIGRNSGQENAIYFERRMVRTTGGQPQEELTHCLRSDTNTGDGAPSVANNMQVRRLTPVECERLQGFPDGCTAIPWRGKEPKDCPDGPRYKALGNSWAVPCARAIGEAIQAWEDMQ